ncbi:TniQ family protein [Variovorax sp. JS1663]|uniref:TniQ family protein n=1 Tax=Variovorax sp. JS1663 TaxID=1851577 RepID=UPI000B343832|nr:TniQ family protein [Variovorax sp. JS1663]OUM02973.1 hypothetical protein A8M77_08510 [Variovorax sp. JS1663]
MNTKLTWPAARSWESVRGFVLRYAVLNGFVTLRSLTDLLVSQGGPQLATAAEIAGSPDALRMLCDWAGVGSTQLQGRAWTEHASPEESFFRIEGVLMPREALMLDRLQVCPSCLGEANHLRADWDLAHVVACARHQCFLLERCPTCQADISPNEPFTGYCPACGSEWARERTEKVSDGLVAVNEDAAGLGDIRFTAGDNEHRARAASFFDLMRVLSHDARAMWTNTARRPPFSRERLVVRARAHEMLAHFRTQASYDALAIRAMLEDGFEHLVALDRWHVRPERVESFLRAARLDVRLRHFIVRGTFEEEPPAALLEGRQVQYKTAEDVAALLGVEPECVAGLVRLRLLRVPASNRGYAFYEIMDCKKFLSQLVPAKWLDELLGVDGLTSLLGKEGRLALWDYPSSAPLSAAMESVIQFLDSLRATASNESERELPTFSAAGVLQVGADARAALRLVLGVADGSIETSNWSAPWRVDDLVVERSALERVVRGEPPKQGGALPPPPATGKSRRKS